jgi:hypothetical protein
MDGGFISVLIVRRPSRSPIGPLEEEKKRKEKQTRDLIVVIPTLEYIVGCYVKHVSHYMKTVSTPCHVTRPGCSPILGHVKGSRNASWRFPLESY